jgi:hypothetical protein
MAIPLMIHAMFMSLYVLLLLSQQGTATMPSVSDCPASDSQRCFLRVYV